MLAKDIMTKNVITVKEDTPVREVIRMLLEKNISGVPVVDKENNLVGIISEADLIYKEKSLLPIVTYHENHKQFMNAYRKGLAKTAGEIMTKDVITVSEDTAVEEIATLMLEKWIKRVPVVKDKKVIGIISRPDIMRTIYE
ncbi:MAG TPA: hypothetical protein DHV62_01985 [Elusimicrobia bacterium]|jgi:CBS domain-containing protein|nr:hypothetical protein [Elusimicrobiota bacterium]